MIRILPFLLLPLLLCCGCSYLAAIHRDQENEKAGEQMLKQTATNSPPLPPLPAMGISKAGVALVATNAVPAQSWQFVVTAIRINYNPFFPLLGIESGPTPLGPWTIVGEATTDTDRFTWTDSSPSTAYFYRAVNIP